MKKITLILLSFLLIHTVAFNQQTEEAQSTDTTKLKIGNRTIVLIQNGDNKEIKIEDSNKTPDKDYDIIIDDEGTESEIGESDSGDFQESDDYEYEEVETGDSDKIQDKEIKIHKKKNGKSIYKARKYSRWAGLNLSVNQLVDYDSYNKLQGAEEIWENNTWKSKTWNLNFLEFNLSVVKKYFLLTTGLGLEWRKYSFKNNLDLVYEFNNQIIPINSNLDYSKDILRATYIQIPLLAEFNTSAKPKKGLYLGTGLIGGFKINSKMIQEYETGGQKVERKINDDFNMNDFQLLGTVRLGINRITFIANMDLLPIFESNKLINSNDIASVNFGIQLLGF